MSIVLPVPLFLPFFLEQRQIRRPTEKRSLSEIAAASLVREMCSKFTSKSHPFLCLLTKWSQRHLISFACLLWPYLTPEIWRQKSQKLFVIWLERPFGQFCDHYCKTFSAENSWLLGPPSSIVDGHQENSEIRKLFACSWLKHFQVLWGLQRCFCQLVMKKIWRWLPCGPLLIPKMPLTQR